MERFTIRIVLKEGFQKKLLGEIMLKNNLSQRKLAKILNVSRSSIKNWKNEERLLPKEIFIKVLNLFPRFKIYNKYILTELPRNWAQIKGGKIRSKMKNNLTRKDRVKAFQNSKKFCFKRKIVGPKGELMFNKYENRIAECLLKNGLKYQYEPEVLLGKNYAFPDFLLDGIIIERCGFGNFENYWSILERKISRFNKYRKENIIILVPIKNFKIATKRLKKAKDIVIMTEEDLKTLPLIIKLMGPGSITTQKVVDIAQPG